MKRLIALLCILITLMSAIATANAASYDGEDSASLTAQEISVLQEKLIAYGYGTDNFASDTLYDPDGCPTFMLGITDAGYIILERDSLKFRECGGGNPYRDYGYYFAFQNLLANFKDIPAYTDWSYPGIFYAVDNGIMSGTTSTTFSPYQPMTRAMLVSALYRMAGSPSVTYTSTFSDVPKSVWYADCVIWASKNNIAAGVGDGKFNPSGSVTREQLVTILYRYANYRMYDTSN